MLAPHAVDIAVIVSSLIASLCFSRTIRRHISPRQVKLCIGQRKYKQKFTTQGRKEGVTDRPSERIRARSLNSYFAFCKIVVKNEKCEPFCLSGCLIWLQKWSLATRSWFVERRQVRY